MKKLGVSRRDLFERLDRPALRSLPPTPYAFAGWTDCGVNIDYHIEVAHNYYSVPYQLLHQRVEARRAATTVAVFLKGRRIASHRRMISSARTSMDGGMVRRRAFAVLRLITSSNLVGCSIGRSPGLQPLRILAT
jgi:hypothetical protein